jgi:hypothetical protein
MMNRLLLAALLVVSLGNTLISQNYLHVFAGYSVINPKEWNKTIQAYNFSRPWLASELPLLHNGFVTGIAYSGVLRKGLFISPEFQYNRFRSEVTNESFSKKVKLTGLNGQINFDIYPLEFNLDSVGSGIRPFIRIGAGGSLTLPRVFVNDSVAMVNNVEYTPKVWVFQAIGGLGCRFTVAQGIDVIPLILYTHMPSVDLEDFNYALHGTALPGLNNLEKLNNYQFLVNVSFKLGASKYESKRSTGKRRSKAKRQ